MNEASERWGNLLSKSGYEHHIGDKKDCRRIARLTRTWKKIFRVIGKNSPLPADFDIFEAGCGGGGQLAPFALRGYHCVGLDVSEEVLERGRNYIKEISDVCGKCLDVDFVAGDILDFNEKTLGNRKFHLVFHVGVLEHFLDDNVRLQALKNMFSITKPGGYLIVIVPSGIHPLRRRVKEDGWGGYNVPEMDYSPSLLIDEFEKVGAIEARVMPNNVFGYLLLRRPGSSFFEVVRKMMYYALQMIPTGFWPRDFAYRHSMSFIGIARKPWEIN